MGEDRWSGYDAPKDLMPLGGYAALMGIFSAGLAGFLAWATRRSRLPTQFRLRDAVLFGIGTHKLARIITKDFVTSPLRAPFVEFEDTWVPGEVIEKSRGHGLRRATGDLLTCEYCIAPWVAGGLLAAHAVNPGISRFIAGLFTTVAISDFANQAYTATAKRALPAGKQQPRGDGRAEPDQREDRQQGESRA